MNNQKKILSMIIKRHPKATASQAAKIYYILKNMGVK